ncbi:hypothetical protein Pyn_18478 [Prunus yedoensis var. nudiflora]|uniref:Uncharacterized protein n=1 Tax=Prunus yedoensis var. nudiflora TaxID=2094558 RepID=A0A314YS65_PRUYE|nr:hypothetical protein Pyn_18478 [Prunus yedoensis var. nudiflora]
MVTWGMGGEENPRGGVGGDLGSGGGGHGEMGGEENPEEKGVGWVRGMKIQKSEMGGRVYGIGLGVKDGGRGA